MPIAIVSGALANKPFNGGEAWVRLSWVLGLRRLGFDTYFVERIASEDCVDPAGHPASFEASANLLHFETVVREFSLEERASLLCDGDAGFGLSRGDMIELVSEAEVLFNLSGHLDLEEVLSGPRLRVYVDLDPGYTQAWHADPSLAFRVEGHNRYVTVGLNVGQADWPVPADGIEWVPTLPPVVLDEWPWRAPEQAPLRFTTVATWRGGYGGIEIDGRALGQKHHEMRRILALPERVPSASFEIALDIHPADASDLEALRERGWQLADPRRVASTPAAFREYVSGSGAEFSVAQSVYTETASGWFSDRTACYLASGRPALVQDTGLGRSLPLGEGLLSFSSLEEAVEGAERIAAEHRSHAEAARAFAEAHLDSDRVLGRLLSEIGVKG